MLERHIPLGLHPHCKALDVSYAGNAGYIRRTSTMPTTDADLSLPSPGSDASLTRGGKRSLVVDTTAARVTAINTTLADGIYGVGQEIPIVISFTGPVGVNG